MSSIFLLHAFPLPFILGLLPFSTCKSDVIVALNLIINAENARDAALAVANPSHVDLRGKSCLLLAACLEGRGSGGAIHHELSRRLDTYKLQLYKLHIEHAIHEFLALQVVP
jgi:hypothetical protein